MTMIERGSSACAALTTYEITGEPPISCSTFARLDFILVPSPAAIIKTFRGLDDVLWFDISRKIQTTTGEKACFRQLSTTCARRSELCLTFSPSYNKSARTISVV